MGAIFRGRKCYTGKVKEGDMKVSDAWTSQLIATDNVAYYNAYGIYPASKSVSNFTGYDQDIWSRKLAIVDIQCTNNADASVTAPVTYRESAKQILVGSFKPSQEFNVSFKVLYK